MTARKADESYQEYRDRRATEAFQAKQLTRGTVIWLSSKQGAYKKTAGPIGTQYLTGAEKRAAKRATATKKPRKAGKKESA